MHGGRGIKHTPHILIYCHCIDEFYPLLTLLSQSVILVVTTQWDMLLSTMLKYDFDLLLLEMPQKEDDLFRLLDHIKETEDVKMILLDGSQTAEVLVQAFKYGVKDYFPTPIDQRLLGERVLFLVR
ncbi:hypothetical protein EH223_18930 [candidate division KSB1 bacterium]|nr:hypothetical protein [candidate division KSB1 bacterium]RQW00378.1 MAG: hypothetical protein EH223_18930 [candidate division KSB1 bacterium]